MAKTEGRDNMQLIKQKKMQNHIVWHKGDGGRGGKCGGGGGEGGGGRGPGNMLATKWTYLESSVGVKCGHAHTFHVEFPCKFFISPI